MDIPCHYRNHVTVVLSNLLSVGLTILLMMLLGMWSLVSVMGYVPMLLFFGSILLVLSLVFIRFWQKTEYTFTDSEIIVTVDLVSRKVKRIQYSRLASVNIRRNIFNVIFGTSTLMFNVNSSVNSNMAEASLCLRRDEADALREELSRMIFDRHIAVEEESEVGSLVSVSNPEIIIHGFLAQPTASLAFGMVMLAYSIYCLMTNSSGGFLTALLMMAVSTILPWVRSILKYYNYRIYRVDDTVTVESGLVSTYRSSFKVSKVNSVRIRQPLIARLLGMGTLEAEVVGMAGDDGMPLLCPMKARPVVEGLLCELIPEFTLDNDLSRQPRAAILPMVVPVVATTVLLFVAITMSYGWLYENVTGHAAWLEGSFQTLVVATYIIVVGLMVMHVCMAHKHRAFTVGDSLFRFIYGGLDISSEVIRFDKVQMASVRSGPIARRFGLARCRVHLISSMGARSVTSGLFEASDLEKVGDEVMSRIVDGRYDYRDYL